MSLEAIHAVATDTNLQANTTESLLTKVDSLEIAKSWTWPCNDPAGDLTNELRASPAHELTTARYGGDQLDKLVDKAARRGSSSESGIFLVAGGEALASLNRRTPLIV